tara:strand:+ start:268 stop:462 length:195 start_codon:yes stop_codon:yes gene_type:complete
MEIPTDKIIEAVGDEQDEVIKIIKAQALEIVELQAVIVRLRDELQGADREVRLLTNELNKMEGA